MAKYYFDGAGKGLRPVIAMCVGHAFNIHTGRVGKPEEGQRMVAIISEMIHTASLVHDDILDHAETRRGKVSLKRISIAGKVVSGVGEPEVGRPEEHDGWGVHSCGGLQAAGKDGQPRGLATEEAPHRSWFQTYDMFQVVEILSQVLADLVQGEFMQLQTKQDEEDRFEC